MADEWGPDVPVAEVVGEGLVWDPVKGVRKVRAPIPERDDEVPLFDELGNRIYRPQVWRDPMKCIPNNQKDRLIMTRTGAFLVARLNRWRKWVAHGIGVCDPVAYMEIAEVPGDLPWYWPDR